MEPLQRTGKFGVKCAFLSRKTEHLGLSRTSVTSRDVRWKTSIMSRAVKRTERFTAHRTTFESCFSHYNDLIRAQKHLFSSPKHHLCLMLFYCTPQKKVVQVWKIFLKMWGWQLKSVGCCFGPHWPSFYRQKQFNKSSFVFHRRKSVIKN